MIVTTTNSTHKPKDTELEIKNKSPVFKLPLFSLLSVFVTVPSWQHYQAQTPHKKEGTLLKNMQRCSCNLVGMSYLRKIRCFHKRFCNTVPAVVIALGHPEPFNHSPGHLSHDHIFVVTKLEVNGLVIMPTKTDDLRCKLSVTVA